MTVDTTFKEFVDREGFNLSLLDLRSRRYKNLVRAFNEAKLKLKAERMAREYEEEWASLKAHRQPATMAASGRRAGDPKDGACSYASRVWVATY